MDGAEYASTDADPATFVVPGNASPAVDGAPVFGSIETAVAGTEPVASLPATDRVRLDAPGAGDLGVDKAAPVFRVHIDGGVAGWMTAPALVAARPQAPRSWVVDDGSGAFSPMAMARRTRSPSPSASRNRPPGRSGSPASEDPSSRRRASGRHAAMSLGAGSRYRGDGEYAWTIEATDAWGNGPLQADGTFTVDTQAPS